MPQPLPASAIYEEVSVATPRLSPDGCHVAFVRFEKDPHANVQRRSLFVVPTDGSARPRRLTRIGGPTAISWSPNGERIGFIASREVDVAVRTGSDDPGASDFSGNPPQVWSIAAERPGDARQVTTLPYGVHEFDWGPDGHRVVASARDPRDAREYLSNRQPGVRAVGRLHYKSDEVGWLNGLQSHLFVCDVESRDVTRIAGAHSGFGSSTFAIGMQPTWSSRGEVAFLADRSRDAEATLGLGVYIVSPDGPDSTRLVPPGLQPSTLAWSPDGRYLAFTAEDSSDLYRPDGLYVVSAESGELTDLSAGLDRPVVTDEPPAWVDESTLVAIVRDEAATTLVRFGVDDDSVDSLAGVGVPGWELGDVDYRSGRLALLATQPADGTDVFVGELDADGSGGAVTRLTRSNRALASDAPMPGWRRVEFAPDDGTFNGIAYYPGEFDPDDPDPRPLLVSIPGGPVSCDVPRYQFDWAYWTSRGYVVLRVNYRGSSSFGRAFAAAVDGEWGTVDRDDVLYATADLVERGWAARDQCVLQGFSYGATLGAFVLAAGDGFRAAVLEHGNYDFRSCYGTSDIRPYLEAHFGTPWENPDVYDRISPITDVGSIDTPTLVIGGGEDRRTPLSQSEQLYTGLRRRGVDARLIVFENERHTVSTAAERERLEVIDSWLSSFRGE